MIFIAQKDIIYGLEQVQLVREIIMRGSLEWERALCEQLPEVWKSIYEMAGEVVGMEGLEVSLERAMQSGAWKQYANEPSLRTFHTQNAYEVATIVFAPLFSALNRHYPPTLTAEHITLSVHHHTNLLQFLRGQRPRIRKEEARQNTSEKMRHCSERWYKLFTDMCNSRLHAASHFYFHVVIIGFLNGIAGREPLSPEFCQN